MAMAREQPQKAGWRLQLALRCAGLALLAGGAMGVHWLIGRFGHGAAPGGGDPSVVAIAFLVFAAGSAGLMLATLGPGLMQRHAVPLRYRRLRSVEKSIVSPDYRGLSRVFFGRNSPER